MLLDILKKVEDHRDPQGKEYELYYILYFSVLALISNLNTYTGIFLFINMHFDKLKSIFNLKWVRAKAKKTPTISCIQKILVNVNIKSLELAFQEWSQNIVTQDNCKHIAFDGKVLNGSFSKVKNKRGMQLFEVFAAQERILLAHQEIEDKNHEIPALQAFLTLPGVVVTADAMHCQKKL